MHSLTKTTVQGKDELFATLDTRIKTLDPKTRPRILLTDTVGFIKNYCTPLLNHLSQLWMKF